MCEKQPEFVAMQNFGVGGDGGCRFVMSEYQVSGGGGGTAVRTVNNDAQAAAHVYIGGGGNGAVR